MVSKIQTMRKFNPTTALFVGPFFIPWLDLTCFNDSIVVKIKKPFTFSFFKKRFFIFVTMMILYKFGDLNFSIYPI